MSFVRVAALVLAMTALTGCFGVALTKPPEIRETAIDHTATGIVYKTFASPLMPVRRAALKALRHMKFPIVGDEKRPDGWDIQARNGKHDVKIEFQALTRDATRMRVIVNKGRLFFKDKVTGAEIIARTAAGLRRQKPRRAARIYRRR